ncbi:PhzF family phenazine biosynthesis protein [Herbiconiux daphne]|uniref:PhzF family phenazine biosynthesis protein n=1 Tax=Herbiconiux daphne TaxID=2970914 RepID=A0ABT2H6T6_9MICO|nr:PhzF family phenazine biosynthesis protein [Herbiconiux daphne]MCS5735652.1 PhzF family phenazine biosynthesis protein [Herbiconiux daphne]
MPSTRFFWVDVFAQSPLTGNPLALIPDADGLTVEQMVAIAREFNQSETTFLVTPTSDAADYRLRSFTPDGSEVLGAGHNAMGAWIWLSSSGRLPPQRTAFIQQIGSDLLPVRIDAGTVTMQQSPPRFLRRVLEREPLATALGLALTDLDSALSTEVVSTGAEHLMVALSSRGAVDRVVPESAALKQLLADSGAEGCYVYSIEPGADGADAYTRFFNPTVGIAEDPATGTAAGPLTAVLVRDGHAGEGQPVRILQGNSLGRPSILTVLVDGDRVELSGSGLIVAEGTLHL